MNFFRQNVGSPHAGKFAAPNDRTGEHWVTIGAVDGEGGTPVMIDKDGTIVKGPRNLTGAPVSDIGRKGQAAEHRKAADLLGEQEGKPGQARSENKVASIGSVDSIESAGERGANGGKVGATEKGRKIEKTQKIESTKFPTDFAGVAEWREKWLAGERPKELAHGIMVDMSDYDGGKYARPSFSPDEAVRIAKLFESLGGFDVVVESEGADDYGPRGRRISLTAVNAKAGNRNSFLIPVESGIDVKRAKQLKKEAKDKFAGRDNSALKRIAVEKAINRE